VCNLQLIFSSGLQITAVMCISHIFVCVILTADNYVYAVCSVSGSETAETSSQTTNPMVKLFCGQFLSAGINEGMLFGCLYK